MHIAFPCVRHPKRSIPVAHMFWDTALAHKPGTQSHTASLSHCQSTKNGKTHMKWLGCETNTGLIASCIRTFKAWSACCCACSKQDQITSVSSDASSFLSNFSSLSTSIQTNSAWGLASNCLSMDAESKPEVARTHCRSVVRVYTPVDGIRRSAAWFKSAF